MSEETDIIKKAANYLYDQYAKSMELGDEVDAVGGDVCEIVAREIYRLHDRIRKSLIFVEKLAEALNACEEDGS